MYKYRVQIKKVSGRLNESVLPSKKLVVKSKTKKSDEQVFAEASSYFKNEYGLVIESADISRDFFYPKKVSVFINILNSSGDKITADIKATDPKTGKPIKFRDVKFKKIKSDSHEIDWYKSLNGMWCEESKYWDFTTYLEEIIDCSGGRFETDDDYEQGEEEVLTTLAPIITKLINRAIRQDGEAQILLNNPYYA
jgi:hypothetical protein